MRIPQPSPTEASAGPSLWDSMFMAPDNLTPGPAPKARTGRRSRFRIYRVFRPTKSPARTRARPAIAILGNAEAVVGSVVSIGAAGAGAGS